MFGKYGSSYIGKQQTMDGHIICIGTPGSGKSSAVAIPTLHMWTGAIFAIDIKGELIKKAPYRYGRCVMDPYDNNSYGYDSFEILCLASGDEFSHALNDISFSIIPEGKDEDKFWEQSSRRFLAGAYSWAFYNCKSFIAINVEIYSRSTDGLVSEIMASSCETAKAHMRHVQELSDKTRVSVLENVLNAIELFATDSVVQRLLTRKKTINPDMLLQGNQIFLEIPEVRLENWRALTGMLVNQFFHAMTKFPEDNPVQTLILLDEFPQLGKAKAVVNGMATLRSKGCTVCLLMQSYSQLDNTYGQITRKIITDNAAYKLILSVMDPGTAQEVSAMVGQHYRTDITVNEHGAFGIRQTSSGRSKRLTDIIRPAELKILAKKHYCCRHTGFADLKRHIISRRDFEMNKRKGVYLIKDGKFFPEAGDDIRFHFRKEECCMYWSGKCPVVKEPGGTATGI